MKPLGATSGERRLGRAPGFERMWSDREEGAAPLQPADSGPVHVHGLGVDPADGALFIATHTGLWRSPKGELTARRVTDNRQDTMGFSVVGPASFLGSGHPDLREAVAKQLPPHLGLIASGTRGRHGATSRFSAKPTSTSSAPPGSTCTGGTRRTGDCS